MQAVLSIISIILWTKSSFDVQENVMAIDKNYSFVTDNQKSNNNIPNVALIKVFNNYLRIVNFKGMAKELEVGVAKLGN